LGPRRKIRASAYSMSRRPTPDPLACGATATQRTYPLWWKVPSVLNQTNPTTPPDRRATAILPSLGPDRRRSTSPMAARARPKVTP